MMQRKDPQMSETIKELALAYAQSIVEYEKARMAGLDPRTEYNRMVDMQNTLYYAVQNENS